MSLDDRLSRLRDEADRDIPVPADLQPRLKAAVRAQAPRRSRPWKRFIEIAAACLILGALVAVPLFRPAKPVPGVTPPVTPPTSGTEIVATDIVDLHMATESTGWAMTKNAVLHTADGGATWQDVSPKIDTDTIRPTYFLDGETAWVEEWVNTLHGYVYRTTDGGRTWEKSSVMMMAPKFQFIDRDHGWAMTSHGVAAGSHAVQVLNTADGGKTWTVVDDTNGQGENLPGSLPFGGLKNGVAFRDAQTGWATGSHPVPGGTWFYVTHDGGHTWAAQALPVPPGHAESFFDISPPRFFDAAAGVMTATVGTSEMSQVWYVTTDGGVTWRPGTPLPEKEVLAWDFADARHGWALAGPVLRITQDGGRTWEEINSNLPASDRAIMDFATPTTGWILSNAGLFKSTDGGRTWAPVQSRLAPK